MKFSNFPIKVTLIFALTLMLFSSCNNSEENSNTTPETTTPTTSSSWNLIFEEEFDTSLSSWNVWNAGAFNNEIQLYRTEQLVLENGILKINTQRASVTGPTTPFDSTPKNFEYVSGRIESQQLFGPSDADGEREYRFAARIKLPFGHGMWPAFWSYGDPWPTKGEIDILEARGNQTNVFQSNLFYGTNPNININTDTEVVHSIGQNLTEDFHIYEMVWKQNTIEIFFDEQLIHTYTANNNNNISNFFGKKQKVVLNTAIGGLFFTDQNAANYADSATMEIDWVRIYKK